ncbi:protein tyrosine phosphatase [Guyanagaster necrorhizus]|uniref:Very-long-chain (3R)-3-hydroxyacyl-CoA dehydratase n=1 Tax=Guyanagaster necrorhizus TaxID=856835 RepID=A0A9P8ASX2_9AGAR|nr:protein tyrosine phosphatase [Guyanagaster necrorhizus MCA 3950]KAG7446361.1 protein tyrosine phosphatase [Guyanagaster necrorhizus MCA 3950]
MTTTRKPTGFVKYYLVTYNVLSTLGWSWILILTLVHLFNLDRKSAAIQPSTVSAFSRFLSFVHADKIYPSYIETQLPTLLQPIYRRATTTYWRVGTITAFVQSCAILEVVHVLLGWVRSPLSTTAMQVASRLYAIWGVTEPFPSVCSNPLYTTMVFAWSATEVVRYSFYAFTLLGHEPKQLLYLRYTLFYVLYPLGASSEAFLNYATLPASSPIPSWLSWAQGMWKPTDYIRGLLFLIWWPGLYVMYTHMIVQRQKVLRPRKGTKAN